MSKIRRKSTAATPFEAPHRDAERDRLNRDLVNLAASAGLAIVLLGGDLRVRGFSPLAQVQFGLRPDDLGRPFDKIRHTLRFAGMEEFVSEVIGSAHEAEREVQDQDGRWYSLRARPSLTFENEVDGAVLVLADIDDIKRSEQAIAGARADAEAIVHTVREPLLILNADLGIYTANEAFYNHFKIAPAQAQGRLIYELGGGQWNIPRLREGLEQILPDNDSFENFPVSQRFDGIGWRSLLINACRLSGSFGTPMRILLSIEDVTDREQDREARHQSEERYRRLFESTPMAIFVCDQDAVIQQYNRRAAELWGREPLRGVEKHCGSMKLWLPDGACLPHGQSPMVEVLRTGVPAPNVEVLIERPDGSRLPVLVNFAPLKDARGAVSGVITSFVDITERKRTEQVLLDADRRKDEFLAMLAHELRGPMAPMRSAVAILQHADADAATASQARAVLDRQLQKAAGIVDDLLEAASLIGEHITLRKRRVDLGELLHQIVNGVRPVLDARLHQLTLTLPEQPVQIEADPTRLDQVITNLLTNAAKYTEPRGRITLSLERRGKTAVIRVADNGIGISEKLLPVIFDLFVQEPRASDRAQGGLGIGLTVVRRIVALHSGTVEARSDGLNRGSEFFVRLPALAQAAPALVAENAKPDAGAFIARRILVVDDNLDSATMGAMALQLEGHDTRTAHDGPSAIALSQTFRPEVVLLDIGLPGMDGYEVAAHLREAPQTRNALLVALSGYGLESDHRRSANDVFDRHLVKPAAVEDLKQIIGAWRPRAE